MVPLVIIRPEPGNMATTAAAQALALNAQGFPLFEVIATSWEAVLPGRYDALLIGSANVFRHGGPGLAALRGLPVYAVGEATAVAALAAGFARVKIGAEAMQALLSELDSDHHRLLRLTARDRVSLALPKGVSMDERVVYASQPQRLPAELEELLRTPAVIALHSAEAAQHLTAECVRRGIRRAPLRLAALSPRIGSAAGDGWGEVAAPSMPVDKALLALARQMCQEPWPAGRTAG